MAWTTGRVLQDRNARLYLGGVLVSGFGDSAMSLAAGVWIKARTGSDALAGIVGAGMWLALLLGPVLGGVADRTDRRRLLVAVNLALAAVMAAVALGRLWMLFAGLALVGAGAVLAGAAEAALLPAAVPQGLRGDFNGLVRSVTEGMKLVAPPVGAALFTVLGGAAVALLNAGTFVAAALAFGLLRVNPGPPAPAAARTAPTTGNAGSTREPAPPVPAEAPAPRTTAPAPPTPKDAQAAGTAEPTPPTPEDVPTAREPTPPTPADARIGRTTTGAGTVRESAMRLLRRDRALRALVPAAAAALVASSLSSSATFAVLDEGLHRSPAFAGVLTPAQGLGSVACGLLAGTLLRRLGERGFAALGLALFAAGAAARVAPWTGVVVAGGVLIGLGLPAPLIAAVTAVQRAVPGRALGRAAATANTLMFAPTGPALLLGGAAVALLDYRVQIIAAAALGGLAGALLLRHRRRWAGAEHTAQPLVPEEADRAGAERTTQPLVPEEADRAGAERTTQPLVPEEVDGAGAERGRHSDPLLRGGRQDAANPPPGGPATGRPPPAAGTRRRRAGRR
ncbi:MFS transporter [Dactylosporangium sp. NPDC051485]|uniref:MFS transporter n=1 Tax=Dactylosporangium sp. NPDC051485 TaxID=3154846 RepID=UPI00341CEA6D